MTTNSLESVTPGSLQAQGSSPQKNKRRGRARRGVSGWVVMLVVFIAALLMLFPFWLALINAFKPSAEYIQEGPLSIPASLEFDAIVNFWRSVNFNEKLFNSVLISGSVALIAAAISLLSAYAIGIGRVKGRVWLLAIFMLAFTIPQEALIYPLFTLTRDAGLYDSPLGVIIILAVLMSGFGTYMLSSVLGAFSPEVLEAARIDGASRLRILWHIVLPMSRSSLAVLVTFFFIWTWNEFFLPMVLLPSAKNQTVSVALGALSGQYTSDPTALAAASLAGIIPALIFFLLFQRTLMRGVNLGAVK